MIRAPEHVRVAHMTVPKKPKISTDQVNTTLVKYAIGLTKKKNNNQKKKNKRTKSGIRMLKLRILYINFSTSGLHPASNTREVPAEEPRRIQE